MAIQFIIGIIILLIVFSIGRTIANAKTSTLKKNLRYIFLLLIIALIILSFRFGFHYFGVILGAIAATYPILMRIINAFLTLKMFKGYFDKFNNNQNKTKNNMSKEEAYEILGVTANATKEEIKQAYQNLMKKNHPDKGGSKYFAAKLNQAKDILLN